MNVITFISNGRTGNILFKYFATKTLQNYLMCIGIHYEYKNIENYLLESIKNDIDIKSNKTILFVNDIIWNKILSENFQYFSKYYMIILDGNFKTSGWILKNQSYIQTLFNINNTDKVCIYYLKNIHIYTIGEFVNKVMMYKKEYPSSLIVH